MRVWCYLDYLLMFLLVLLKKPDKIAMFRENKNYRLKYIKHHKTPEIIGNRSNTPPFCC
jgi:hypothetical protein